MIFEPGKNAEALDVPSKPENPPMELGTAARQALIALMVYVGEASNPELRARYRVTITKQARDELSKADLIRIRKGPRNAIYHELTEEGWKRAEQELTSLPPAGVSAAWLLLYGTFRHLSRLRAGQNLRIADVYAAADVEVTLEDRVRQAYRAVADAPGDLVGLAVLRDRLTDVARAELDEVLLAMDRRREIQLDPDPNRLALTARAKDAAIEVGGEDMHLISISRP